MMTMNRFGTLTISLFFLMLLALIPASYAQNGACGSVLEYDLTAGQTIDVGSVTVWNDENSLYVQLETDGDWALLESHVEVVDALADVPYTDSGTPIPGQFEYSRTHNQDVTYAYRIPLGSYDAGTPLIIVVHASVGLVDSNGTVVQQETAFGGGNSGEGSRWWFYITYTVQSCDPQVETTDNEGCTPGYWRQRNHYADWAAFAPNDLYADVFDVTPESEDITLGEAVQARGGDEDALLRHSTAALLNSFNRDVDYPYSAAQIMQMTQFAFNTQNFEAIKDVLDEANNLGCPLGRRGSRNDQTTERGNQNASADDTQRGNRNGRGDDSDTDTRGRGNGRGNNTDSDGDSTTRGRGNGRGNSNGQGNNPNADDTDTSSP